MSETIVSTQAMPDVLSRLVKSKKVIIREDNGVVTVIPVNENREWRELRGILAGNTNLPPGALASEEFSRQKRFEKELEV